MCVLFKLRMKCHVIPFGKQITPLSRPCGLQRRLPPEEPPLLHTPPRIPQTLSLRRPMAALAPSPHNTKWSSQSKRDLSTSPFNRNARSAAIRSLRTHFLLISTPEWVPRWLCFCFVPLSKVFKMVVCPSIQCSLRHPVLQPYPVSLPLFLLSLLCTLCINLILTFFN